MPLTDIQKEILDLIAANRSPESHFAGGVVLNWSDDSTRFSHDFDIFHGEASAVVHASEQDSSILRAAGFTIEEIADWTATDTFRRGLVFKDAQR
ncbi:MAG: hypothetical protein AAGH89_17575, partial [Verrucomicrobiota bacterium]